MPFSDYVGFASLLDSFPVNGGPPPPGWTTGFRGGTNGMDVTGGQARRNAAGFGNAYQTGPWGPDAIAWFTVPVLASCTIGLRLKEYGSGTLDAVWGFYDDVGKTVEVGLDTNGVYATVGATVGHSPAAGFKLGLACVAGQVIVATWDGAAWTDRVTRSVALTSPGGVGIEMTDTTGRIDDVFVGTIPTLEQTIPRYRTVIL